MNKYIVTLTGFSKDPDLEQYCSYVEEMKGTIAKNLSEETNVLVVHETCTEKYKIAKLYKSPIDCVTIGWLIDSRKKNKLLPTRNYSIPSIFYNVVVGVLGFTPEKADKLKKIVEINGGKAHELTAVEQINEWAAKEDTLNLIITTRGQFDRIKHSLKEYTFTFVEIDWLEDSIRTKICKFPSDYAMNLGNLNPKPLIAYTKKLTKKLKECLALQLNNSPETNYLANTLIYLADSVQLKLCPLLKKIIMAFGGMYINIMNPAITHILAGPITEKEHTEFQRYGNLTFVLRIEWLIDSVLICKRMNEEDYFIRSYKLPEASLADDRSIGMSQSLPNFIRLDSFKSISGVGTYNRPQYDQVRRKAQSHTFKDYNFYVDKSKKREPEYAQIIKKIRQNGGVVYGSMSRQLGQCYVPMKDTADNRAILVRLSEKNSSIIPVSFRWVLDCASKRQFIQPDQNFIYRPLQFKTPLKDFHKLIFEVVGVDDGLRLKIKELVGVLGSLKMTPNKSELTHCLCGEQYLTSSKITQIRKQNPNVLYLRLQWLFDCVKEASILPTESYLIEKNPDKASKEEELSHNDNEGNQRGEESDKSASASSENQNGSENIVKYVSSENNNSSSNRDSNENEGSQESHSDDSNANRRNNQRSTNGIALDQHQQ